MIKKIFKITVVCCTLVFAFGNIMSVSAKENTEVDKELDEKSLMFENLIYFVINTKNENPKRSEDEIIKIISDDLTKQKIDNRGILDIWNALTDSEKKLVVRYPFDALKVNNAKNIVSGIKNAFTSINWGSIGSNIISGIANGIAGAVGGLVDAAVRAAKSAFNAAKKFLGINSPSRLFRDKIGKYMALGMGVGFEQNVPTGDMTDSLAGAVEQMQKKVTGITTQPTPATVYRYNPSNNKPGESVQPFDYERMGQETAKAMEGMGVYMDSKPVGKLVTPTVNNELGKIGKRKT